MNATDKIVTSIPLKNIWTDESELSAKRIAYLTSEDIVQLLKKSGVRFIVADVGHKLQWIDTTQRFDFWKQEAKPHLTDGTYKIDLDGPLGNYAYVASQWAIPGEAPIITLEKFHQKS